MDESIISQPAAKSKAPKKQTRSKAKKTNKPDNSMEIDSEMEVQASESKPEPPKAKRATRGKKRPSDSIDDDGLDKTDSQKESPNREEHRVKRRSTKSHDSTAQFEDIHMDGGAPTGVEAPTGAITEEKPKRNGRSKKGSSKGKKGSITALSETSSNARLPRDSDLDKALEADLDSGISHAEASNIGKQTETTTRKARPSKSKSSEGSKAVPEGDVVSEKGVEHQKGLNAPEEVESIDAEAPAKKTKTSKGGARSWKATKKSKDQVTSQEAPDSQAPSEPVMSNVENEDTEHHDSFISVEISTQDPPPQQSETETAHEDTTAPIPKKRSSANKEKSGGTSEDVTKARESLPTITAEESGRTSSEKQIHEEQRNNLPEPEIDVQNVEEEDTMKKRAQRRSSRGPPKTVERYSDLPQAQHFADSIAKGRFSNASNRIDEDHMHVDRPETVSPLPPSPSSRSTSSSPQSSDAENHPPSANVSKPSAPNEQTTRLRLPLATSTLSPSKGNAKMGFLHTSHPWMPIDIESIIFGDSSDKENGKADDIMAVDRGLSSPEKKMTVDEWISWNAKLGEDRLKRECERLVSLFEREGGRALRTLEGIECID